MSTGSTHRLASSLATQCCSQTTAVTRLRHDLAVGLCYCAEFVQVNNEAYLLVREEDILARLEDTDVKVNKSTSSDIPDMRDLPKS